MQQAQHRFRLGLISPRHHENQEAADAKSERLLPAGVEIVSTSIRLTDYTHDGVEEALLRYWPCVDELSAAGVQRISFDGFPIAAQLTRPRLLALLEETHRRTGLPSDSDAEATVDAMRHLGVTRIAVASRWADELNNALSGYLRHAGFDVVSMTSEGQWASEAFQMSIERGVVLAFRLGRQAMREAPQADALLLPGGTWHSLAAMPILEEDFGVPVFSNPTARVWRLIHEGIAPPVAGWGKLLATP